MIDAPLDINFNQFKAIDSFKNHNFDSSPLKNDFENLLKDKMHKESSISDEKLKKASRDLESFFVEHMFERMTKNLIDSESLFSSKKSFAEKWAQESLYKEYAKLMSKTMDIGIAHKIYNQLKD